MGSNQGNEGISLTWACFWDWLLDFPWIPALYTGVFSTGLCLWGEVMESPANDSSYTLSIPFKMARFLIYVSIKSYLSCKSSSDSCIARSLSNRNGSYLRAGATLGSWLCLVSSRRKVGTRRMDWSCSYFGYSSFSNFIISKLLENSLHVNHRNVHRIDVFLRQNTEWEDILTSFSIFRWKSNRADIWSFGEQIEKCGCE